DFSLKFKKQREIRVPFWDSFQTYEFTLAGPEGPLPFSWRPGPETSLSKKALEIGGRFFAVELQESERFGHLHPDLMVVEVCAAPPQETGALGGDELLRLDARDVAENIP